MADEPKKERRVFVLALGMLIGFIGGFVMLLSRLPVDGTISGFNTADIEPVGLGDIDFEYYSVLPEQTPARTQAIPKPSAALPVQKAAVDPNRVQSRIIVPASTTVKNSRPIPVTNPAGQQSYFLQAGTYPRSDEAERARVEVLRLGLEAFIVVRQDDLGNVTHRVRVGPFINQTGLNSARTRLKNGGIPFQIVRVTG